MRGTWRTDVLQNILACLLAQLLYILLGLDDAGSFLPGLAYHQLVPFALKSVLPIV